MGSDQDLGRLLALVVHYHNDVRGNHGHELLNPVLALAQDARLRKWLEREERLAARGGQPLVALSIGIWVRTMDGTVSPDAAAAAADMWAVLERGMAHVHAGAEEWRTHTGMTLDLQGLDAFPPDVSTHSQAPG